MFENDDPHAIGGVLEYVDAINMGNGCFSGFPAVGLRMSRCRCGWNKCHGQGGRAPPTSQGRMWAGPPLVRNRCDLRQQNLKRPLATPSHCIFTMDDCALSPPIL